MYKTFNFLLLTLLVLLIVGCGSLSLDSVIKEKLQIEMYGVYTPPEGVSGNADPVFIDFILNSVSLNINDQVIDANYNEAFRIIDRPQIIYEADLNDYENLTINEVQIDFDSQILIQGKYQQKTLEITNPKVSYAQPISIKKGHTISVIIQVWWRNIITQNRETKTEEFSEPYFNVIVKD